MSGNEASDSECLIEVDSSLVGAMKTRSRKRSLGSSPVSNENVKRRKICDRTNYKSPLVHLAKNKIDAKEYSYSNGKTKPINLDDSVIVLEELESLPIIESLEVSVGTMNQPTLIPDDSIIVISDNDGEVETETEGDETNCETIPEDNAPQGNSQLVENIANTTTKKVVPTKISNSIARKVKNNRKNIVRIIKSSRRTCKLSNRHRRSVIKQSIIIDCDDENTVPNDDVSKLIPQVQIITVDNSPDIIIEKDVPSASVSNSVVNANTEKNGVSSQFKDGSLTCDRLSVAANAPAPREDLASLPSAQETSENKKAQIFCIDLNGTDSALCNLNKKSKKRSKKRKSKKAKNSPSCIEIVESAVSVTPPENKSTKPTTLPVNQPNVSRIGNYYNKETVVKVPGNLRDIVIDGCNIAMSHSNNRFFSEPGLKLVIDFFKLRGHTVKVFVPQHKRCRDHQLLESLYLEGIVVFTPSRLIGGRRIVSYDDRYILDYATMCDGIVVSQDQYRDLYWEKPEWKNIIENRLLIPTFVGNCVMFPDDPLGRRGPRLEEFLRH